MTHSYDGQYVVCELPLCGLHREINLDHDMMEFWSTVDFKREDVPWVDSVYDKIKQDLEERYEVWCSTGYDPVFMDVVSDKDALHEDLMNLVKMIKGAWL